jgi:hypothetical protein
MSKEPSPQGIAFEGEVLTGEKSVEQKQRHEAILAFNHTCETYKTPEDYDPILRYHLGLTNPKITKRTEPNIGEIPSAAWVPGKKFFANEPNK